MNSQDFLLLALHHLARQQGGPRGGGAPAAPGVVGALGAAQALAKGLRGHFVQGGLRGLGGVVSGRGLGRLEAAQAPPAAGLMLGVLGQGAGRGRLAPPSRRARRHRMARPLHPAAPAVAATATPAIPALPLDHALHRLLFAAAARGRYPGLSRARLPQGWLNG